MWLSKHLRISKEYVERRQGEPIRFLSNGFFWLFGYYSNGCLSATPSFKLLGNIKIYMWVDERISLTSYFTVLHSFIFYYLILVFKVHISMFQIHSGSKYLLVEYIFLSQFSGKDKLWASDIWYSKVLSLTLKSHWMAQWAMPKYFDS